MEQTLTVALNAKGNVTSVKTSWLNRIFSRVAKHIVAIALDNMSHVNLRTLFILLLATSAIYNMLVLPAMNLKLDFATTNPRCSQTRRPVKQLFITTKSRMFYPILGLLFLKKFVTLITAPIVSINAYSQERHTSVRSYVLCSLMGLTRELSSIQKTS